MRREELAEEEKVVEAAAQALERAFVKAFHGDAFFRGGGIAQLARSRVSSVDIGCRAENEPGAKASAPEVFRAVPQVNQ